MLPTDDELRESIRRLIPKVDIEKTGINAFINLLSKEEYGGTVDLSSKKKFIRNALTEAINEEDDDEESDNDDEEEEDDESDDEDSPSSRVSSKKKKKAKSSGSGGGGGGGGLSAKKEISPELGRFLGVKQKEMARTEIVKMMWAYIRENDLQNPKNKKEIILDDKMKEVFGCDMFTMFTMNKYISAHVHPFKPVDLTPKDDGDGPRTKRKRRNDKKSPTSSKKKRSGTQPPYRLSPALAAVAGTDVLPRPQVVKALWAYIRENNLQVCTSFIDVISIGSSSVLVVLV
jgi:upstream activation factor subunit UAF30